MTDKKIAELAKQFEGLTIKKQMKVLAHKAANSRLYYKEILEEFEKTLLQATLEKYDHNKLKMSLGIKLHRCPPVVVMRLVREGEQGAYPWN